MNKLLFENGGKASVFISSAVKYVFICPRCNYENQKTLISDGFNGFVVCEACSLKGKTV